MGFWDFLTSIIPTTVTNPYQQAPADLATRDYRGAISEAEANALAGYGQAQATGARQTALADALLAQSEGRGPSLAQEQLKQGSEAMARQVAGAIASQRGINPGLAQRLALQTQGDMQQQAAGQAALLRLQEQLQARQQLAAALAAQRGQDIGQQQASTGLYGTAGQGQQGQNALNVQNTLGTGAINASVAAGNQAAAMEAQRLRTELLKSAMQAGAQLGGSALNAAGGAAGVGAPGAPKAHGGEIRGHARARGDSHANDTVPAMLSPGEIVLPRSVAQHGNAPDKAADFVAALKRRKGQSAGPGRMVARLRSVEERLKRLERGAA